MHHSHISSRPRTILIVLIAFVAAHAILFYLTRQTGISRVRLSGVLVSGVIVLVIAKHLGLFAALVRFLHGLLLRRSRSGD